MAAYKAWSESGRPSELPGTNIPDYRKSILAGGFRDLHDELVELCKEGDEDAINGCIEEIIGDYGTGVVVQTKLGGCVILECQVDTTVITDTMFVNGKITADIQQGLFKLKGKVEAAYRKAGSTFLSKSNYRVKILGGDRTALSNLVTRFTSKDVGTEQYTEELNKAMASWVESLNTSEDVDQNSDNCNKSELLTAETIPIWNFFSDRASQNAIKKYFKTNYPGSKFVKKYAR